MERATTDRPGRLIFLSGVVVVIASTALGFYLAGEGQEAVSRQEFNQYLSHDARMEGVRIRADSTLLANVHALMWMTFGLGVCLTIVGLRMWTRPSLEFHPLAPIGLAHSDFEKTK